MTNRQFLAWQSWLADQWNEPSLTDHYLMVVASEVGKTPFRVWGKNVTLNPEDYRIRFGFGTAGSEKSRDGTADTVDGQRSHGTGTSLQESTGGGFRPPGLSREQVARGLTAQAQSFWFRATGYDPKKDPKHPDYVGDGDNGGQ